MSQANTQRSNTANRIGRYEIKSKAGEGASGVVYRATDPLLDREVAIKLARVNSLTEVEYKQVVGAFYHEAKIAGKFAHENVVTIYDMVSEGGLDYIVMEYVPGRSVQDYMDATGPLDVDEALSIAHKCCMGLGYIHFYGVIHRDIKPGNIMYHPAQGIAKLMDFSISHKIEEPPVRDNGTIAYMAPEHFDSERSISLRTDIFALGSTMYRILTGKYPFNHKQTAYQILHQDPEPITSLRPSIPQQVADIINKAMAKSDSDRFNSAWDFANELEAAINNLYPGSDILQGSRRYMG